MEEIIYLDNGATTAMESEVFAAMEPYLTSRYGNPMSIYGFGAQCRQAVEKARKQVAELIGAEPEEIIFTSGGTESDNWAIKGAAAKGGGHILTTDIEHPAVLQSCQAMEALGFAVTKLPADRAGIVQLDALKNALQGDTALVSVMAANNEVGTIQPIEEMGEYLKQRGICFHTDAVQAAGHIPVDVKRWKVDLLSASGHKFGGPKGAGFLYIREGSEIGPLLHGGAQERNLRAGTHNVPAIAGMGAAAALAGKHLIQRADQERCLQDYFINRVLKEIPDTCLNGDALRRLPGNCNFRFAHVSNESLLILLDRRGICASAGSACAAGAAAVSHVLSAMGLSQEEAKSSIRFTLSYRNTRDEIDRTVEALKEIVGELRSMSPLV